MQVEFLLLFALIIVGFGFLYFLLNKKQTQSVDPTLLEWIKSVQNSLQQNQSSITHVLQENSKQLNDRLDRAAQVIGDVNREVGKMSEIGRNMQELQDFLKSPKLRGNIGEHVLKDLIAQIFPKNSFHLQYGFRSGEKVDAAIQTDAGILPIDSKFPMENFQKYVKAKTEEEKQLYKKEFGRDVKKHIDAISQKYILPDEGTMDFALMYVPSESVFYEIANMEDVLEYARTRRVYVVSPSTLYAHLQTILLSFEGKKIESRTKEVFALLRSLQIDHGKVQESLDTLGKHLTNASGQYTQVTKGFATLGTKISSTKHLEEKNN
ncbi:MAG TPA: DNA recombination protein RmuC [Patescibacteria group bacterium]|nr:DNA recombination protein RmuC [Patescibacteria group bacterium]